MKSVSVVYELSSSTHIHTHTKGSSHVVTIYNVGRLFSHLLAALLLLIPIWRSLFVFKALFHHFLRFAPPFAPSALDGHYYALVFLLFRKFHRIVALGWHFFSTIHSSAHIETGALGKNFSQSGAPSKTVFPPRSPIRPFVNFWRCLHNKCGFERKTHVIGKATIVLELLANGKRFQSGNGPLPNMGNDGRHDQPRREKTRSHSELIRNSFRRNHSQRPSEPERLLRV